jgi:hypothetical protein
LVPTDYEQGLPTLGVSERPGARTLVPKETNASDMACVGALALLAVACGGRGQFMVSLTNPFMVDTLYGDPPGPEVGGNCCPVGWTAAFQTTIRGTAGIGGELAQLETSKRNRTTGIEA